MPSEADVPPDPPSDRSSDPPSDRSSDPPSDPHDRFPAGFFARADETDDGAFYRPDRFVAHIDDGAIAAVGELYRALGLTGRVLDLMSSWISHFLEPPSELTVLGMNERELRANPMASAVVVHDLNVDQRLPFDDDRFDAVTCCVSIDYLVRPIDVLAEAARVVRPGGLVVCTFSNRCFPTKAIRGWLSRSEAARRELVVAYFALTERYEPAEQQRRTPPAAFGDPLDAVWAAVR
jgi:SAM-dependent methyltransferase